MPWRVRVRAHTRRLPRRRGAVDGEARMRVTLAEFRVWQALMVLDDAAERQAAETDLAR